MCNKCETYSNRIIRFRNDEKVTGRKIADKKRKARYTCHKCNITYTFKKLKKIPQVKYVEEGKVVGTLNRYQR